MWQYIDTQIKPENLSCVRIDCATLNWPNDNVSVVPAQQVRAFLPAKADEYGCRINSLEISYCYGKAIHPAAGQTSFVFYFIFFLHM